MQQPLSRHRHGIVVADPHRAVGERQPHRLDHHVQGFRAAEAVALCGVAERKTLQQLQHLQHRQAARRRRRHARQRPAAVVADQGLANRYLILREIGERHAALAGIAEFAAAALLGLDDGPGKRAAIEGIRPLGGNQLQGFCQIGLHQPVAFGQRHATGTEDRCGFGMQLRAAIVMGDVISQKAVDAKAAPGELDRGRHCIGQFFCSPAMQSGVDATQRAGHADRQAAG